MTISEYIAERGIEEVLHFTTNSGLTGILRLSAIKCRNLLRNEKLLEHIFKQSCPDRRLDAAWHGYVNLSITRINSRLFNIASENWHSGLDGWWCVIAISPEIMEHDGVHFTTTNNIYPACQRRTGLAGLKAMYAPSVAAMYGYPVRRFDGQSDAATTCFQAEVLYPKEVPLKYVRRIYFRKDEHADAAFAIMSAVGTDPIECVVDPTKFK